MYFVARDLRIGKEGKAKIPRGTVANRAWAQRTRLILHELFGSTHVEVSNRFDVTDLVAMEARHA